MYGMNIYFYSTATADAGDEALLSPDELLRANRFVGAALRRRYVAAHTFLRRALARHAGVDPASLRFGVNEHGKPLLPDLPQLQFNLSHSGDWALCGIAEGASIGVDIEEMRPLAEHVDIAARFFSSEERSRIARAEDSLRTFYDVWAKKEAVVKADGRGLSVPLQKFSVPTAGDGVVQLEEPWAVHAIDAPDGYAAATAFPARVRPAALRPREFPR